MSFSRGVWGWIRTRDQSALLPTYLLYETMIFFSLFLFLFLFFLWRIQLACCEKYFGKKEYFFNNLQNSLFEKKKIAKEMSFYLFIFKSSKFVAIVVNNNNMRKGGEGFLYFRDFEFG